MTRKESAEFIEIINELKKAEQKVFQTDWFNYSFLGNGAHHLHCHFIPRYEAERKFEGITFHDKLWGHNYKTDPSFETTDEIREKVKEKLIEAMK